MATKNRFSALLHEVGVPAAGNPVAGPAPVPAKLAKRNDPQYRQISTYVRTALYKEVRKRLTDEERDFADLLDELLVKWMAKQ
jgi:hypothetical protein